MKINKKILAAWDEDTGTPFTCTCVHNKIYVCAHVDHVNCSTHVCRFVMYSNVQVVK